MTRRRPVHLVSCVVLVAVVLGASASAVQSATPPKPVVTVTPNGGLADLQVVTMTGTGFSANASLATVQCRPGATGPNDCDLATLTYLSADASGSFTTKRAVHRLVGIGGANIDCAKPSSCVLAAANLANYAESNGVVLGFDPNKPFVVPKVSVTPSTGLVDHQLVTVKGSGFAPLATVTVSQCQTPPAGTPAPGPVSFPYGLCDSAAYRAVMLGTTQDFTTANFPVQRFITTYTPKGPGQVDCAKAPGCVITVRGNGFGTSASFNAPISFDPRKPAQAQDLSLAPSTGLSDHQLVTVRGSGFLPGAQVAVLECAGAACDYAHSHQVTPGLTGVFTLSFAVERFISFGYGFGSGGPPPTDCAASAGACVLRVNNYRSPNASPSRPLSFDPSRGPVAQALRVDPNHDLRDNQIVTVRGRGFLPMQPVQLIECSAAVEASPSQGFGLCDASTAIVTSADRHGNFEADDTIRDVVSSSSVLSSCLPRECVLVALSAPTFYAGGLVQPVGPGIPVAVAQPGAAVASSSTATTTVPFPGTVSSGSAPDEHVTFPYVTLEFATRSR